MSRHNRKGYTTVMARTPDNNTPHPVAVRKGSVHDRLQQRELEKFKKMQKQRFRDYKKKLREQKKGVPAAERANINWSQVPREYL